ncbi:phosphoethanolamine transferase [[Haemophilus] ducreyi]|uniref:phosphoethanolamine transferase n=1 Tax=Haemophilus ducreyi TaxID=730 RepID=UPI000654C260|nr:phosphoethanolamine transferase [[Haemophilus] ducreyi]AKO48455.1 membrane protein [[Haemophilus] ducreyi]AKO49841.1 membrane protein [[Haemophilus] ducreyi]
MKLKLTSKQACFSLIAILLTLFASYVMLKGSGFFPEPNLIQLLLTSILIIVLGSSRLSFYLLLLPITFSYAIYTPIGLSFGPPSYQYIASLFATDLLEAREFLSQLSLFNYLAGLSIILAVVFFRKINQKYHINLLNNRTFIVIAFVISSFSLAPFKLFHEFFNEGMKVKQELAMLNSSSVIPSEWGESTLSSDAKYDDYVLIIGESARKDYHHAYGYPVDNTPFMSNAKGTLIDGFTSGGTNTIASLKLLLTKPDTQNWEGNYRMNVIELVNSAGINTFWLSNQGYLGQFDTPISSLANKSNKKIFLKSGDSFSQNISDFELLPKFIQIIEQKSTAKRFIVLHLYSSHPITCDRLTDYPKIYDDTKIPAKYHDINCYLSSIKKTDQLIEKVYKQLKQNETKTGRRFSMIYFSDHGLIHSENKNGIHILNTAQSKFHFDVPLFKISSDDQERHVYKVFKSGLNFTDGIGKWLGIINKKLNPAVDLFSNQADDNDYGLKQIIEKIPAKPDPAVIIPIHQHKLNGHVQE